MFTRCPACHTLFRIQPKQLKAARGQVRCGSCQAVFDGLEFMVNREDLSKEELAALAKPVGTDSRQWQLPFDDPAHMPLAVESGTSTPDEPAQAEAEEPESAAPSTAIPDETDVAFANQEEETAPLSPDDAPAPPPEQEPAPAKPSQPFKWSPRYSLEGHERATAAPHHNHRLGWGIGSLLLLALLAGQIIWFNRDALALDERWRPWLQMVCERAGCKLPPQRDPGAIEMVDRNVQSHPQYLNALLITATLVNQAPFAQPYPQVELTMTDLDQKAVASRRFLPAEYLEAGKGEGLIPSGAAVRLKLEIADPGEQAVGFEFKFF